MKRIIDIHLVKFYLWVGFSYLIIGVLTTTHTYTSKLVPIIFNNLWAGVYLIAANFILFEYSIPFVLKRRKSAIKTIFIGILLLWAHMMFYSYGAYWWRKLGVLLHIYTPLKEFSSLSLLLQSITGYSVASVFFFGIIRHLYNYVKLKQAAQQLRIEKQEAELSYLKSQTNPHFLFNTLNNIYSLARDKSDLAPESILRLSKIMRFMLYETSGQYISIEQELKVMADYIALEQLRYDESLRINYNYDVEDMKQALPPLLLIPLVENAFKHGAAETRSEPFVNIHLTINKRALTFVVKNSADATAAGSTITENIGLSNLRRQLELLFTDYSLSVLHNNATFTATLKINLASHV